MAETRESTIIDVKLDAGKVADDLGDMIKRIQALKAEQATLNAEIKAGNDTNGEYAKALIAVKDQLSWCQKQASGLSATTKLLNSDTMTYDTTLNGQRQKLADMQKAYAQLDATQRDSKGGQQFLEAVKAQSDAVKGMESAMGDNTRNVGNYQSALQGVIPQLGGFTSKMSAMQNVVTTFGSSGPKAFSAFAGGIKSATSAALKFIATPIGAVIAAIAVAVKAVAAVFGKLADAFKKNDDAGTALARMLASFQPILTAVNKAFDTMASGLGKLAGKIADFVAGLSDASRQAQQLVTDIDNLQETERQYTVNSAKRNKEVARLRNEAASAGDPKVRKQKLQQAIDLEKQNLADEKKIAQQRVKNLEAEAKKNADTSDATKDKIAQAKAAQYQAEEAYYSGTRRMAKELTNIDAEEQKKRQAAAEAAAAKRRAAAEAAAEAQKAAAEAAKQAAIEAAEKEKEITRMAEDWTVQLIQDEGLRAIAERKLNGEREIADLKDRLANEKNLTDKAKEELQALITQKQEKLDSDLETMKDQQAQEAADKERERQIYIAEQRQETVEQMRQGTDEEQTAYEEARWEAQKETWQLQMEDELANIELTEEEKEALRDKWNAVMEAAEQEHQDKLTDIQKKANEVRKANNKATAQATANFMGTLSDILADYGEENKAAAAASKALALGKIAVETGIAIASGVAQAQSVGFPANIAAILTTVTTVMANIATAISTVKSAKFASGGVVSGGSYGQGDTVSAMLSPQEVVLNPEQQAKTLFAIASGAGQLGGGQNLAEVVVAAVQAQPAPVLEYSEFTTFQKNVVQSKEFAKI